MTLTQEAGFNLTSKQKTFADAYIKTRSAPEAALSAYNCSSRNSARVMGHKTLHNPKVRFYMQEQVLTETLADEGVESLRKAIRADKVITNRRGEIVATWPDWGNRIKAAIHLFKLITDLTIDAPQVDESEHWEARYMFEHDGRKPTASELEKFKEVKAVEEEIQIRLFSSEERLVDLRPSTFLDE